jgi:hypothetical protein
MTATLPNKDILSTGKLFQLTECLRLPIFTTPPIFRFWKTFPVDRDVGLPSQLADSASWLDYPAGTARFVTVLATDQIAEDQAERSRQQEACHNLKVAHFLVSHCQSCNSTGKLFQLK